MESPKQARTTIVSTVVAIISTTIIPSIVATVLLHTQIPHRRNGPIRKGVLDAKQNPFFEQRLHTTKPHQPTYIATIVPASSAAGTACTRHRKKVSNKHGTTATICWLHLRKPSRTKERTTCWEKRTIIITSTSREEKLPKRQTIVNLQHCRFGTLPSFFEL